ncbi:hypothetical protein BDR06DRAFT_974664 [Suillus hirtellus]|nr:hypothetical protein BDR06DRAFT_974664 [Suillus hirtellus]
MDAEKPAYLSDILGTITDLNICYLAVHDDLLTWKKGSLIIFSSPVFFLRQDEVPKYPTMCKLPMKNMLQSVYGLGKNLHSISIMLPHVTEVVLDQDVREIADSLVMESYDQKVPPLWSYLRQLTIKMSYMTTFHYLPQLSKWLHLQQVKTLKTNGYSTARLGYETTT